MARPDSAAETLAIPAEVRRVVDERDGLTCRMCGKFLGDRRAHHHVVYGGDARGMGGRRVHNVDEIVTLCWMPGDNDCHDRAHSNKFLWQPLLLRVVKNNGLTALQLRRWQSAQQRKTNRMSNRET